MREIERRGRNSILPQVVADLTGKAKAGEAAILRQPVAELDESQNRLQLVAKLAEEEVIAFLQQLVAEIPWAITA